jgi:hypothetical protein
MGRVNYGAKAFNSPAPREGESELERGDGRRATKMKRKEGGEYIGGIAEQHGSLDFSLLFHLSNSLPLLLYVYGSVMLPSLNLFPPSKSCLDNP